MRFSSLLVGIVPAAIQICLASASNITSIQDINGPRFLSPYAGKLVSAVEGLVTAKGPSGFWIRSTTPDSHANSSNSIYVFSSSVGKNLTVGDIISLDATVSEYRSSAAYLYLTELTAPKKVKIISSGNEVKPIILGEGSYSPPTKQFTSLDNGNILGLPNNSSQVSVQNSILQPDTYGLDFWESLCGELVMVQKPTAIAKPNTYGDTWVIGSWTTSGQNSRGGLTLTDRDSNPEAILIADPLDGSGNPKGTKLGDSVQDITGVVTQAFGYYAISPLTALNITASVQPASPPPTTLLSTSDCSGLSVGSYNVENLSPKSAHLPNIAAHIVDYLKTPDLMFLQEIQDNNGATNDNVTDANSTLSTLVEAIRVLSNFTYGFTDINPVDDKDGGEPGGNIRVAYLYNPAVLRLRSPNPGSSTDANAVFPGPELKYNPGRIDPLNTAWTASRKPLVAAWETLDGENKFFTVNVHFGSKGGGSSIEGDARPPVNGGVYDRLAQANATASFIASILQEDSNARIITSGDFNEFAFVAPLETFRNVSQLQDLDDVVGTAETERYSYIFDMNCQELDHMYVSQALTAGAAREIVHVNTWASFADQISDHDPSVARLNVCHDEA